MPLSVTVTALPLIPLDSSEASTAIVFVLDSYATIRLLKSAAMLKLRVGRHVKAEP